MKENVPAATLLLCGSIFTSPARTRLWHRSLGSKQRQSSMVETEESAMDDENHITSNITSNITSDTNTEAEAQENLCQKGGTGIQLFGFGLESQTLTRQR